MKCEYGCGNEGKFQMKNGKWCCSKFHSSCPAVREKCSNSKKGDNNYWYGKNRPDHSKRMMGENNPFYRKTHSSKWKNDRKKTVLKGKDHFMSKENPNSIKRRYELSKTLKGRSSKFKGMTYQEIYGKEKALELIKSKCSNKSYRKNKTYEELYGIQKATQLKNNLKLLIEDINNKYIFFSKIEEMRYNPNKVGEKEIQIHCKNHNCPNSKEQSGWFTPTYNQLNSRIKALEKDYGNGGCYFYCCEECKQRCPLYRLKSDPFKDTSKPYTNEEYNIWKTQVLNQDNYECQMCGSKKDLYCHHIIPIKLEPIFALDPDNGIVLCKNCHYKYGHKTGTE